MSSSDYLNTTFIGGWVTVLALAGAMGYQYYSKGQPAAKKEKPAAASASVPRKQNRAKKQRQEAYSTAAQKAPVEDAAPAVTSSAQPKKERDEESDNKAFAAQMASVQTGKKFDGKSGGEKKQKQKSVKQSHAAEPLQPTSQPKPAAASSTESVEADNDQESSVASPEVAAADPSGVSDMLEPTPSGPSVLRLTDTDKQKPKPKVTKAPEQVETKKQRQNRKKAEERKLAREEDEKQRKVLMEKQRRTAREAAGVPAKDGSQFLASVNGGKSAWDASAANGTGKAAKKEALEVQPLDTFETTTTDAPAASIAPAKGKNGATWTSSLPSEEEQLELLKEEDDAWNTVPAKTSKKGKKAPSSEDVVVPSAPAKEARPVPQPLPVNGKASKPAQSYGSFSALTVKGTDADEDDDFEEKEWDV